MSAGRPQFLLHVKWFIWSVGDSAKPGRTSRCGGEWAQGRDGQPYSWSRILVSSWKDGRLASLCDFDADDGGPMQVLPATALRSCGSCVPPPETPLTGCATAAAVPGLLSALGLPP